MLALVSCFDENFCNSKRALERSKPSCAQSRPAYFSCETKDAEMLSGLVAHPAKSKREAASMGKLSLDDM
jgi:hypothetical protein